MYINYWILLTLLLFAGMGLSALLDLLEETYTTYKNKKKDNFT